MRVETDLIICQACGASLYLDPDQLIVAAAETIAFADAHGQHAEWGFTLKFGVPVTQRTADPS